MAKHKKMLQEKSHKNLDGKNERRKRRKNRKSKNKPATTITVEDRVDTEYVSANLHSPKARIARVAGRHYNFLHNHSSTTLAHNPVSGRVIFMAYHIQIRPHRSLLSGRQTSKWSSWDVVFHENNASPVLRS